MPESDRSSPLTERGLERRIKRAFNNASFTFAAIAVPGLEPFVKEELEAIAPGCIAAASHGIVEFSGTLELLYRVHLHCRTISRILMRITSFTARSYPELFNKLSRIHWEPYTGFADAISITASSTTSRLHHTENIRETACKAINAYLASYSLAVHEDSRSPLSLHLRICNDECTVSIDASGALLYKRGFRTLTGPAPLRETTAAALLMAADWRNFPVIADPFCGSGSIISEAILLATATAPGLQRDYAFQSWPSFNPGLWNRLKTAAVTAVAPAAPPHLFAGDIDPKSIDTVRKNLASGPVQLPVTVECRDAFSLRCTERFGRSGLIISNLPYGKRITTGNLDIDTFYRRLGTWLRGNCHGWHFAFLVADPHFERKAALRGRSLLSFSNGGIRVRLVAGTVS